MTRRPAKSKKAVFASSLAARLKAAPSLSDAKAARAKLADLAAGEPAIAALAKQKPVRRLLEGIADGSPFLWETAQAEPQMLVRVLQSPPEARFAALVEEAKRGVHAARDEAAVARALRRLKREAALIVALADIGGVWSLAEVTRALTVVADTAVGAAIDYLLVQAHKAGKLTLPDPKRPAHGAKYFALAMGKYGAGELNYSSDIDLIVLYDPSAPVAGGADAGTLFVRLTRNLVRLLQDRTADGYVFRVDLRLRPDPGSTQIAIATDAALTYYERAGETWERAAFIKARAAAGDVSAGEAFLQDVSPFVWRRYLDHAAIAEVHAMKRQIHAFRGHGEVAVEGHNIKLGRGGIREIEFFAQTQQLIAGGRAPRLRGRETLPMLAELAKEKWIDKRARDELTGAYVFLRRVEHRLQMVGDEQTHTLPQDPVALDRFARFLGLRGREPFAAALTKHLTQVQAHYAHLFEDAPPLAAIARRLEFPTDADDRETLDTLSRLGFRQPLAASAYVRNWLAGGHRSLRHEAARADLAAIIPTLLDALARTGHPDAAIVACDHFFAALPGAARLLAAMRTHPDLVELLAVIFGTAPRLAEIVAQAPSLLDGLLDPAFFGAPPGEVQLTERLAALLADAPNHEELLDRARRFGREHMVLIGVRVLSGALSASQAGEAFARLADVLIRALHRAEEERFATVHGRIKGAQSAAVAFGKLGGREMTAGSDLDLVLLYDSAADAPQSDGGRPLHAATYYARLTQRLVSALTTPTNAGKLYDVDLRLRPSGRSGPVATSLASFAIYQRDEAWTWEHMALTRARVVSATPVLRARIETLIRDVLCRARDPAKIARDGREMRGMIAREKGEGDRWDLKYAAGGLIDIEFTAQFLVLGHAAKHPAIVDTNTVRVLGEAQALNLIDAADGELLRAAAKLYHDLTQLLRLCLSGRFDAKTAGPGLLALLARAGGLPDFATLEAHLADTQARVRRVFSKILGKD
ncbi:MAG TPA: bifunctional [glutamine synthetase] adenylyltransferase/[glutamine synthetase]-adenylyl-L-tyrosine phosphorylase [Xanthobacteraceae bacterium]|nr:bifunctional [glutamine synthetase] adenylyltransferase/[glutamine synthetase]-adenylyl-L-tyrosine phosphorylase [Xanthobacteraceae bacterium]